MSEAAAPARDSITARLDPAIRDRIQRIAASEQRSVAGYLNQLMIDVAKRSPDNIERRGVADR
jgi:hypothetical protein